MSLVTGWADTSTTADALAAFGLVAEKPLERQELKIWPENWLPLQVFSRMTTQLIVGGMGGVVGLRYESLPIVMRVCQVGTEDESEVMSALQVMERRMVELLNERK